MVRKHQNFTWEGVDIHPYKEDGGTHFKSITRQTLLEDVEGLPVEMRYFEMQADGHSTLERHNHIHMVMIIRGSGEVLVGDTITKIAEQDVVHVQPMTWHQFRATNGEPLGFLCIVASDRDKPQRPTPEDLENLRLERAVSDFIRI
ncbi:1-methylthio-xylulose 5-phosphate sulfo-lyase [soil metagenome]